MRRATRPLAQARTTLPRLRRTPQLRRREKDLSQCFSYQEIYCRSRKKPPVGRLFGSVAVHAGLPEFSSIVLEVPEPPISDCIQPGQTELTRMPDPLSSEARMWVRASMDALETRQAGEPHQYRL